MIQESRNRPVTLVGTLNRKPLLHYYTYVYTYVAPLVSEIETSQALTDRPHSSSSLGLPYTIELPWGLIVRLS